MNPTLIIGGVALSTISWLNFDQKIEEIGGSTTRRFANGRAYKLTRWKKHRITLSASGWVPPALWGVNYDQAFMIELPMPLLLNPAENLPDDFEPREVPFDERPVVDQSGASGRYVFIKAMVIGERPSESSDGDGNKSWEMTCETV